MEYVHYRMKGNKTEKKGMIYSCRGDHHLWKKTFSKYIDKKERDIKTWEGKYRGYFYISEPSHPNCVFFHISTRNPFFSKIPRDAHIIIYPINDKTIGISRYLFDIAFGFINDLKKPKPSPELKKEGDFYGN